MLVLELPFWESVASGLVSFSHSMALQSFSRMLLMPLSLIVPLLRMLPERMP